jgi:hypothetical protein
MAVITWLNKIDGSDAGDPQKNVNAADMNLIKTVVNTNDGNTTTVATNLSTHAALTNNPHAVTKTQVGLPNVDNTSDANKPVSTAQATAIGVVQTDVNTHEALTNNPHSVTKTQVGLSNVDNTTDAGKPVSTAQQTAIDAKVADAINNGTTTIAPSQNAVFDALALKANSADIPLLASFVDNEVPSGTIDGLNDTFTIANTPIAGSFKLYNAIRLKGGGEDYTLTGTTIVFVTPPELGSNLQCDYRK